MAATDVVKTVHDEPTQSIPIDVSQSTISDQMFDMIIEGTPETSFINNFMEKCQKLDTVKNGSVVGVNENKQSSANKKHSNGKNVSANMKVEMSGRNKEDERHHGEKSEDFNKDDYVENKKHSFDTSIASSDISITSYTREFSVDSLMSSTALAEYGELFSGFEPVGPYSSVPGLSETDVTPSTTPVTNIEASREVRH